MAAYDGTNSSETIDIRTAPNPATGGTDTHSVLAMGGNDTVYGSQFDDYIYGQVGNDILYGFNGIDFIHGGSGNDQMYGGSGNDYLVDDFGDDRLDGGAGDDILYGGAGNDQYFHSAGGGVDIINDGVTPSGQVATGYGGGTDSLRIGYTNANFNLYQSGNDLLVTTTADMADGVMNEGVIVQNFFLGGNYVIETLITSDNYSYNLALLV